LKLVQTAKTAHGTVIVLESSYRYHGEQITVMVLLIPPEKPIGKGRLLEPNK